MYKEYWSAKTSSLTWPAHSCLKDFPNIDAVIWAKSGLLNLTRRKDVFAVLPTGFGKSIIFQLFPCVATCPYIWKAFAILRRNVIKNCCFAFVFDHERSSLTVKTTRVLGCNHRNRRRIGRGLGKVINGECEIVFGPGFPNQGWREKIAPPDGCTGFRWSHSVTVVRLTIHMVSNGFWFHVFIEFY